MEKEKQKIKVSDVKVGMVFAESVYVNHGGGSMMIARKDTAVDDKILDQLERYEVWKVSVYVEREPGTGTVLLGVNLDEKPIPEPPPKIRIETATGKVRPVLEKDLRTSAIEAIRELFKALQTPGVDVKLTTNYEVVRKFEHVLNRLVPEVTQDISGLIHIQDLKTVEDFPYHHSLSVAILSIATGKAMGFYSTELIKLARCAILHDIGKPYVPRHITGKKGKLSDEEYTIIKEHTITGANNLKSKGFGDIQLWNGIMFHHERVDGTGYPKGLTGDEIPLFSKIIAVADTYDAATSRRPHRAPMSPADAYELISSEVGKAFDFEIVRAFAKHLILYPVGTAVELSDGRIGVITNAENVLRPVVELRDTGKTINLADSGNLSIAITRVASAG